MDVIFSGSASRKPLNSASVTLIFDNSDRVLPIDFSEVSIKRVAFRSGENEYYIAGNNVYGVTTEATHAITIVNSQYTFTIDGTTYIIEHNKIIKEVTTEYKVLLKSRNANYTDNDADWNDDWYKVAKCQLVDSDGDGYSNTLDCSYTVASGDDAREIYVYSLYAHANDVVIGETNKVPYISDYNAPETNLNMMYGNLLSAYNPNGTTDRCLNMDYANGADCSDNTVVPTKNIIFDSNAPIVETPTITYTCDGYSATTNYEFGETINGLHYNNYLNDGCSGIFNIVVKEANYEELFAYLTGNHTSGVRNVDKIRIYSYNPDGSLMYLDEENDFVVVRKEVAIGATATIQEHDSLIGGNRSITIQVINITITVEVKEEQYVAIESANRYEIDDNGDFVRNNSGDYLKVDNDYYHINDSNRYSLINEKYVLAFGGGYLRLSTKAIYMDIREDAIQDFRGNEGKHPSQDVGPYGEFANYIVIDNSTPEVTFLDTKSEQTQNGVVINKIWFDLAKKSSGILNDTYSDDGTYWRNDNLMSINGGYVNVADDTIDFVEAMSFSITFRYVGSGSGYLISSDTFSVKIESNNLKVTVGSTTHVVINGMSPGQLYRTTFVVKGLELRVYINEQDKVIKTISTSDTIEDTSPGLKLATGTSNLTIYLSNIMIYSRALVDSEIALNHHINYQRFAKNYYLLETDNGLDTTVASFEDNSTVYMRVGLNKFITSTFNNVNSTVTFVSDDETSEKNVTMTCSGTVGTDVAVCSVTLESAINFTVYTNLEGTINGYDIKDRATPENLNVGYNYYETNSVQRWFDAYYRTGRVCADASCSDQIMDVVEIKIEDNTNSIKNKDGYINEVGLDMATKSCTASNGDTISCYKYIYYSWENMKVNASSVHFENNIYMYDSTRETFKVELPKTHGKYYLWIRAVDLLGNEIIIMDTKEYVVDTAIPVLTGFDIMRDENKVYDYYQAGEEIIIVASFSEVVHYDSLEGGLDYNLKFGDKPATGNVTMESVVEFDVDNLSTTKSGINIIFKYIITDEDIVNLRNSTGDNGTFIIDFEYNGMSDMYGNIIDEVNGNLAYAQMLDKQANFEITGNDVEKDKLTERFHGFQAIDVNGNNIPNQTVFEAIDENVVLKIRVYFNVETEVNNEFNLVLKDFNTNENPIVFTCPSSLGVAVPEVVCQHTIMSKNSIDVTGFGQLISGSSNEHDQLINEVSSITYNNVTGKFTLTFVEETSQHGDFTVLLGKVDNNNIVDEILATCLGFTNSITTTCTTNAEVDDETSYDSIRSGSDTNPWILDRMESISIVASNGDGTYSGTNKKVYNNGETLYLEVVFDGRFNVTKEFSATYTNGVEGIGLICEATSGIGSADGKTKTICSTVVHVSNVVDISDYIGTITADTINPWVSGFRLMENDGNGNYSPALNTSYLEGDTIYIQAMFSEKVLFSDNVNLVVKGSGSDSLLFTCTVPATYTDYLICSYAVVEGVNEEINQLKVIAVINQSAYIIEDSDSYDAANPDAKIHIVKNGDAFDMYKEGVKISTLSNAVDMAGNPLDTDMKTAGNIDYGDLGADDPSIDLKNPEILEIVGPLKANGGPFVGEEEDEIFYKENGAVKYVVTVDDKNNMYINWCKTKFFITTRISETETNLETFNLSAADCILELDAENALGYVREYDIELDGVKYAMITAKAVLAAVIVNEGTVNEETRRLLTLTITITAYGEASFELYFEIEEGMFMDLAGNPNANSNSSYYVDKATGGVATVPDTILHIDNDAPEAVYIEQAITEWYDISGNSYSYSYKDGSGVYHNNVKCDYEWQTDGSMRGCVEYNPIEPDIQKYGEVKPIVNVNETTGRDEFINENYFGRTLFKKDFTIEVLLKVKELGERNIFTITSVEDGNSNGSWEFKFNFDKAIYLDKVVYFALVYNAKDAYDDGTYLEKGRFAIYSNIYNETYNSELDVYKEFTTLDIMDGDEGTDGIVGSLNVTDTSIETITFGDSNTFLYSIRTYSGPSVTDKGNFGALTGEQLEVNYALDIDRYVNVSNQHDTDGYITNYLNLWYDGYYRRKTDIVTNVDIYIEDLDLISPLIGVGIDYENSYYEWVRSDMAEVSRHFSLSEFMLDANGDYIESVRGCDVYSINAQGVTVFERYDGWSCSGEGAKYFVKIPLPAITDGRYTLKMTMYDKLGNMMVYDLDDVEVVADDTPPYIPYKNAEVEDGYDAVLIYPLGGGKINDKATVLVAVIFNERLNQDMDVTTLPDMYIRFARKASNAQIDHIPANANNVKVIGKAIVYKYQLIKGDNGDLELSPYTSYDPLIEFKFMWNKYDASSPNNIDVMDIYGNKYAGVLNSEGVIDSQHVVAIQPPAFITGDTRAPYIKDIRVIRDVTNNKYYHYNAGDVIRLQVEFNEPVEIYKDKFYIELVGDSGSKHMAVCTGYAVSSVGASYMHTSVDCSYTVKEGDNLERFRISTLNEVDEQVPVEGNGVYEMIDAIKLCYTADCSDLKVTADGLLYVDLDNDNVADARELYDQFIMDELGTTLTRKVTYGFSSYYHADEADEEYKKETELIHSYDLQAWYSPSTEITYNMKIENGKIITTRAISYDEFTIEVLAQGAVGSIVLNKGLPSEITFAIAGCEAGKICHIVIVKEAKLDANGNNIVDVNGNVYDLKVYVVSNEENYDADADGINDYSVVFQEERTISNASDFVLCSLSVDNSLENIYAVRLYSASIRLSISEDNAQYDNEILKNGSVYNGIYNNPFRREEIITEERTSSTSILFISYNHGDVGITLDTIAPIIEIKSEVKTVDWDEEARKYVTSGIISEEQNESFINYLKSRVDTSMNYSDCTVSGESNDTCSEIRYISLGKYLVITITIDEINYHIDQLDNVVEDLINGMDVSDTYTMTSNKFTLADGKEYIKSGNYIVVMESGKERKIAPITNNKFVIDYVIYEISGNTITANYTSVLTEQLYDMLHTPSMLKPEFDETKGMYVYSFDLYFPLMDTTSTEIVNQYRLDYIGLTYTGLIQVNLNESLKDKAGNIVVYKDMDGDDSHDDERMASDKFMFSYKEPEDNLSYISTDANYLTAFEVFETGCIGEGCEYSKISYVNSKMLEEKNKVDASVYSKTLVYRNPVLMGAASTFKTSDMIYFKVNFGSTNDVVTDVVYKEGTISISLKCQADTNGDGVVLCGKEKTENLVSGAVSGVFELEGNGAIYASGGSTLLVSGGVTNGVTNVVLEPFEALLDNDILTKLMSNEENTRRYNHVYYIDLITIDFAGNKKIETRSIHLANLTPYAVIDDGSGDMVVTSVVSVGDTFEMPSIIAYSLDDYMFGGIKEINTYKYMVYYEGRLVEKIDSTVVGNYEVFVEIVSPSGRTTLQRIVDLVVEGEFAPPIVENQQSAIKESAIITTTTTIIALIGFACISLKKRKSNI